MGNYTKQKKIILEVIAQMNKISNAEEIYQEVKKIDSKINPSTVYRNLKCFVEDEILIHIPILNGPDKYYYKSSNKDYGFTICVKCGKIQEFICDFDLSDLEKNIFKQTGTSIMKREMLIKGVCDKCILK